MMTLQGQVGSAMALCWFLASPSLADITNVNIDGGVSGIEDIECDFYCPDSPATFSNSQSQLGYGPYTFSGSGSQTVDLPMGGSLQATGTAQQTADTTASGFSIDLMSYVSYDGSPPGGFGSSYVSNSFTLAFHLTQTSILDLNGSLNGTCFDAFGPTSCSNFGQQSAESIDLSGSGFDFNQQADLLMNDPVNFSAILNPGDYALEASSTAAVAKVASYAPFEISLDANFTAAIPEPSETMMVPVLLFVAWGCRARRRQREDLSKAA